MIDVDLDLGVDGVDGDRPSRRSRSEDRCSSAGVGHRLAADVHHGAAAVYVETDGLHRFVHHGPLFALVTGELSANGRELEHDGRHESHVVCALPSAVPQLAIVRRHAFGDGCALADVRCECFPPLSSPSGVLRNRVPDGCMSADDGCLGTAYGCSRAADVPDDAAVVPDGVAVVRVEADACRRLVHHGPLFAFVTGELSANGRELERDGRNDAQVLCELAPVVRQDEADACEGATHKRRDPAVGRQNAAMSRANAAVG
jgi:hypothetical protein